MAPQETLPPPPGPGTQNVRKVLRRRLIAEREKFASSPRTASAHAELASHLVRLLHQIEPELLGVYWPMRGEFNAIDALESAAAPKLPLALPFARREPRQMHYRRWDGLPPMGRDDYGLPSSDDGAEVVPDVVLVPCVGYTAAGFRLGYGGGFFDRWLAAHPQVTAIGVAWSIGRLDDDTLPPEPHDQPLAVVVTEHGVVR